MDTLRKLRKDAGKTQQFMANYLGISQQAYATYENKTAQPPVDVIKKLARFFSVTIDFLLDNPVPLADTEFFIPPVLANAQFAYSGDNRLTQEKIDEIARFAEYVLSKDDKK